MMTTGSYNSQGLTETYTTKLGTATIKVSDDGLRATWSLDNGGIIHEGQEQANGDSVDALLYRTRRAVDAYGETQGTPAAPVTQAPVTQSITGEGTEVKAQIKAVTPKNETPDLKIPDSTLLTDDTKK